MSDRFVLVPSGPIRPKLSLRDPESGSLPKHTERQVSAHCGLWQTVSSRSIADVRSETQLAKLDKVLGMKVEDVSVLAPLMPRA